MKQQTYHNSNETGEEQHIEASQQDNEKFISCHLKLSPVADKQLVKVQRLLREENIKLSKTSVINFLLENLKMEYFNNDLADSFGDKLNNKIAEVFLNSDMNDEDLELLKQIKRNSKNKSGI